MKKSFTALLAVTALGLAACGGVDRDGTRDQFIKDVEELGATAEADCVDAAFDGYSDDEIKAAVENPDDEQSKALGLELVACIDFGG